MRKPLVILMLVILAGCAGMQQRKTYVPTPALKERFLTAIAVIQRCLPSDANFVMVKTDVLFAMADDKKDVRISEGFVKGDTATLLFVLAHEVSHVKLRHTTEKKVLIYAVTGAFIALGAVVPGAGLLNHAVNPVAVKAYSREQELEADKMASESCLRCFKIPIEKQVAIMNQIRAVSGGENGGGFWSTHPSWDDRIANIQAP